MLYIAYISVIPVLKDMSKSFRDLVAVRVCVKIGARKIIITVLSLA